MKKILLAFILVFILLSDLRSEKEFYNWYFGFTAGMNFDAPNNEPIPIFDGKLNSLEGSASISDQYGNLLFYTNGETVWNKKHQIMKNGNNLYGHNASAQSSQIVQFLDSSNKYYIFTTDARPGEGGDRGLCYSVVDMNMDNGSGEVIEKNITIFKESSEKQCLTWNEDSTAIWIITHKWNSDEFHCFQITKNGILKTPVINKIGSFIGGNSFNSIGFMKISPNGKKLAHSIYYTGTIEIFNFDAKTGILSIPISFTHTDFVSAYGLEFSPDSKILYLSVDNTWENSLSRLYQFETDYEKSNDVFNSRILLATDAGRFGALQIGPNEKIYMANYDKRYLSVIHNPNKKGSECSFQKIGVDISNKYSRWGLPAKPLVRKTYRDTCIEYVNFSTTNDFYFVGSARKQNDIIRLTDTRQNLSGATWLKKKINFSRSFKVKFKFRISEGNNFNCDDYSDPGADGIAFLIQNTNPYALGFSGGGIGYDGIKNSIAVEFDLFSNDSTQIENFFDPNGNHIAIQSGKEEYNSSKHSDNYLLTINPDVLKIFPNIEYCCAIEYNSFSNSLFVFLDTTFKFKEPVLNIILDIRNHIKLDSNLEAFIGFTSGTGCATQNHDITFLEICGMLNNVLSIEEEADKLSNHIEIYPNPFSNQINISVKIPEQYLKVKIIDIFGNEIIKIYEGLTNKDYFVISHEFRNEISTGIYFLKIITRTKTELYKIISIK